MDLPEFDRDRHPADNPGVTRDQFGGKEAMVRLVEFVGGPEDGQRESHPPDDWITTRAGDGRPLGVSYRVGRPTPDGRAEVSLHEDHDEIWRDNRARIVDGFRRRHPRHRIESQVDGRGVDFRIESEGWVHESGLARAVGLSPRTDRPSREQIIHHLHDAGDEVMGVKKTPPLLHHDHGAGHGQ